MTSRPPPRTSITRSRCSVRTSRNSMSERLSRRKTRPLASGWNGTPGASALPCPARGADPEAGPAGLLRPSARTQVP